MPDATQEYIPGLEGVIAGESDICEVNPDAGLFYRGYSAEELAQKRRFEDVAHLLLFGELPTPEQMKAFRHDVFDGLRLPGQVIDAFALLPRNAEPMNVLRDGIGLCSHFHGDLGDRELAPQLLGNCTAAVATAWRVMHKQPPVAADDRHSLARNFLLMLEGKEPTDEREHALDVIFTLYAEHDFNASTFTARVIASTLSDMTSAVIGAVGALKGPLHGGANELALQTLRDAHASGDPGGWLKDKLVKKEKLMGFGHRVYKKGDGRVPLLREMTRTLAEQRGEMWWHDTGVALENAMWETKQIPANADLWAAPLFHLLGIPHELNTPIFACSRVAGWCAHIMEQQANNRIIRPRGKYTGPGRRQVS